MDTQSFLQSDFSAQAYANAIIEGRRHGSSISLHPASSPALDGRDAILPSNGLDGRGSSGPDVVASGGGGNSVTTALSQLNIALDDIGRLIKEQVAHNATALLHQAKHATHVHSQANDLSARIADLLHSTQQMKSKVTSDYDLLRKLQSRSSKLESAQELLRTSVRFVLLCKRLDAQMYHAIGPSYRHLAAEEGKPDKQGGGGQQMDTLQESQQETDEDHHEQQQQGAVNVGNLSELAKAAETLKLLEQMLAPPSSSSSSALKAADADAVVGGGGGGGTWEIPLNRLKLVEEKREWIANARGVLTDQMEDLVVRGLKELSPSLLSESFQTALNLGGLPELVQDLLADLTDVVRERTRAAFDVPSLLREVSSRSSNKSMFVARKTEAMNAQDANRFSTIVWKRLKTLLEQEMPAVCKKVYTMEKVLQLKRSEEEDEAATTLLEDALTVLEDKPSLIFWRTLAESIEGELTQAIRESHHLKQLLEEGFQRLLQLFQEFFGQISVYTDTLYTLEKQSPEASMLISRLSFLSQSYVSRVKARLDDSAASIFAASRSGPGQFEGLSFARLLVKELESAKDPVLVPPIKRTCEAAVRGFFTELMRRRSQGPLVLVAGGNLSPQIRNADLASAGQAVVNVLREQRDSPAIILSSFVATHLPDLEKKLQAEFYAPFRTSMRDQLRVPISRMEYSVDTKRSASVSPYMTDLSDRIGLLRDLILPKYPVGSGKSQWVDEIVDEVLRSFVERVESHAALDYDALEGSARLSADLSELEFALSQLLASADVTHSKRLDQRPAHADLAATRKKFM